MTTSANDLECYASLSELQRASDELVQSLPDDEIPLSRQQAEITAQRIERFINQAIATGTALDAPADRRIAQALIDFWVAKSHAKPGENRQQRRTSKSGQRLNSFDPTAAKAATALGDDAIGLLDDQQKLLARRVLLRLVDFPVGGPAPRSSTLEDLRLLGEQQQVDDIVASLKKANILAGGEDGKQVALKYDSLIRQWDWLKNLVAERTNFRDLARDWDRRKRPKGFFIDRQLTHQFRSFGNLDQTEYEFISQSDLYRTRKLLIPVSVAITIAVGFLIAFIYEPTYKRFFVTKAKTDSTINELIESTTSSHEKARDIKWLLKYADEIKIPTADMFGAKLNNLEAGKNFANFTGALLEDVTFEKASLLAASFQKSRLFDVKFTEAYLRGARFSHSTIKNTTFRGANLAYAVFDGAYLCEGVDFSDADLRNASFRNLRPSREESVSPLQNTAWWLIDGLDFKERDALANRTSSNREPVRRTLEKALREGEVSAAASNKYTEASQLTDKAWTLAIYGADNIVVGNEKMNGVALVERALAIADEQISKDKTRDYDGLMRDANDTLGYLLMQRAVQAESGKESEKNELLEKAVEQYGKAITADKDGDILFRYAVARNALGKQPEEALEDLSNSIKDKGYEPTHELFLLRKFITGRFRDELKKMTYEVPRRQKPGFTNISPVSEPAEATEMPDLCNKPERPEERFEPPWPWP